MSLFDQPDVVHLKKQLRLYQKEKGISDPKIGEVLGSSASNSSARGEFARNFYENPEYDVSITQVIRVADFMGRPVKALLFPEEGALIHSEGDHNMNAVNTGRGKLQQHKKCYGGLFDEREMIEHFRTCETDQLENYKDFIEYMLIKKQNESLKKKLSD